MRSSKEKPPSQIHLDAYKNEGAVVLGPYASYMWRNDPKHLLFSLARYKFCAKMLSGKERVLEIGCGDSVGTPIVLQEVKSVHAVDIEPKFIKDDIERDEYGERCTYSVHDMTLKALDSIFDAAYSLDVIEHIPREIEDKFMKNICDSLIDDAICIIGTPNITANKHSSPDSRRIHINLKGDKTLRDLMGKYFKNVFIFSMNDEVVHTGFTPMAHYLLGIGASVKR